MPAPPTYVYTSKHTAMIENGLALFFGVLLAVGIAGGIGGLIWAAWKRDRKLALDAVRYLRDALLHAGVPLALVVGRLPAIIAGGLGYVFGYKLGYKAAVRKQLISGTSGRHP